MNLCPIGENVKRHNIVKCLCDALVDRIKIFVYLTLKHRETHGCVVSTVATDTLVLKHQVISIHNAD